MKIPSKLPGSLSLRAGGGSIFLSSASYDYAFGGLPFISAAAIPRPIIRQTAQLRKEQFDNQQNPGEHSLSGWWLRSQQSFHSGAGQLFSDPGEDNPESQTRFLKSKNVNVWTKGIVRLLNEAVPETTLIGGIDELISIQAGTTPAVFGIGAAFYLMASQATTVKTTWPVAGNPQSCVTDGTNVYVMTSASLWKGPIPSSVSTAITFTKMFDFPTPGVGELNWLKQRLIIGINNSVYEVAPTATALGTAKYTSTAPIVWTSFAESTNAVYAVGNNGTSGAVLKFVLDNTGALPTLTGAGVACQLPGGEIVKSVFGYLGSFIVMGTNKGVRVAVADDKGDLTYGPILWEPTGPTTFDFTARDRFVWCTASKGIDGISGLYRIDLSVQVGQGRYAYNMDLLADGDSSDSVTCAHYAGSDEIAFATGLNLFKETTGRLAKTGYLQTSRIRFSTLEPKIFKLIRVRGPILAAPLGISILDQGDHESLTHIYPTQQTPGQFDVMINRPDEPQDFISVHFTLNANEAQTDGAVFTAYQVKAFPASPRQRIIQLPVWCFDHELDKHGQRHGGNGTAWKRILALEALEARGDAILFQDFVLNISRYCVIDQIAYKQEAPPPKFRGWGGIVTIQLRTID